MTGRFEARAFFGSRLFAAGMAIASTVVVTAGLVYFYFVYPHVRIGPQQPLPFSHRLHVGVKQIDCRFCHPTVERGFYAGMPPADKCLFCHQYIIPEHPFIRKLKDYADRGQAVPWRRVVWIPDHVFFTHQRHLRKDVQCVECHGDVETMDRIYDPYRKRMGFCITCHRTKNANLDCWGCHK